MKTDFNHILDSSEVSVLKNSKVLFLSLAVLLFCSGCVFASDAAYERGEQMWKRISSSVRFNDVIEHKGQFIAVGDDGKIKLSDDLIQWRVSESQLPPFPVNTYQDCYKAIAAGNGKLVVVGVATSTASTARSTTIVSKDDGKTWKQVQTPTNERLVDIAYGNGFYVITGQNSVVLRTITSLSDWAVTEIPDGGTYQSRVYYGNGVFVYGASELCVSQDGLNWSDWMFLRNGKYRVLFSYGAIYAKGKYVISTDGGLFCSTEAFNRPASPSKLYAEATSSNAIRLSWNDNSNNETHFILWSKGDTDRYVFLDYVDANVKVYLDQGLKPGTTYSYKVAALNDLGHSQYAAEGKAATHVILPPKKTLALPNKKDDHHITA